MSRDIAIAQDDVGKAIELVAIRHRLTDMQLFAILFEELKNRAVLLTTSERLMDCLEQQRAIARERTGG